MKKKVLLISSLLVLVLIHNIYSQKQYQLIMEESELVLQGTSTMHDWHMDATDFYCEATLDLDALNNKQIVNVLFKAEAKKVLSDKKMMDKKAHKAMKAEEFPEIEFLFESLKSFNKNDDEFNGIIIGHLTLAGEKRKIEVAFEGILKSESQIEISGNVDLKMTDFGMKPPAFAFGAIKTGDEIALKYKFIFNTIN